MTDVVFPDARLAVFEDRLIYEAQPPISDAEIARIEANLIGPVPPDLAALWRTCYGGRIDYDLDVRYGAHIHPFAFCEVFYPRSPGYHDLDGWITHEKGLLAEIGGDTGRDGREVELEYLPFGGFEYAERLYVRVGKNDYGAVYAFSEGLPPAWPLRLHEDSSTRVADSVRALFQLLYLERNPVTSSPEPYPTGLDALEAIDTARETDKLALSEADRLKAIVVSAVADWHDALEHGTLSADPRLARLALQYAAEVGDLDLLQRLERAGINLARPLVGGGSLLDLVLIRGHVEMAEALLDQGLKAGAQTFQCLRDAAEPDLLGRLHRAGATPNLYAALEAARAGRLDNAELLARWLIEQDPDNCELLLGWCEDAARSSLESADRVELGQMGSNITPDEYRNQAHSLSAFAERLRWLRNGFQNPSATN